MTKLPQERHLSSTFPGPNARALADRARGAVPRSIAWTMPTFVNKADAGTIEDVDANRLIDLASGIAVTSVGASHPAVIEAVTQQVKNFTHTCFMVTPYEGYVAVAEKLNQLTPGNHDKRTALFNSGAEAVENAIKVARAHTKRQAIVAFDHAFHGRTSLTMGLTAKASPYKEAFGPFSPEIYRVPTSYPYRDGLSGPEAAQRSITMMEKQIGAQGIAAIIIEPIQGEGGFIVPAPGFLPELQRWCNTNGIVFIADEIQSGIARTGAWFASEYEEVVPDLVTVAKGIAGGMPLSALTGRTEIMDAPSPGALGGTYGGNPVACAAALATLEVIQRQDLCQRARHIESLIRQALEPLAQTDPRIGQVRGRGAMMAIELVDRDGNPDSNLTASVASDCRKQGIILLTCGTYSNVIRLLPPLTIGDALLSEALNVLTAAIAAN